MNKRLRHIVLLNIEDTEMKIAVFGKNSLLASTLTDPSGKLDYTFFRHNEIEEVSGLLKSFDWVVNFAISPTFYSEILPISQTIDYRISEAVKGSKTKFVFISSRKVYKRKEGLNIYSEEDELEGLEPYSINKINQEKYLTEALNEKLLILRVPNIIARPKVIIGKNNSTFSAWLCNQLLRFRQVELERPHERKDFISLPFFHQSLHRLLENDASGIYNVSSGKAFEAYGLVTRYTGGQVVVNTVRSFTATRDDFILSNEKLARDFNLSLSEKEFFGYVDLCAAELKELMEGLSPKHLIVNKEP